MRKIYQNKLKGTQQIMKFQGGLPDKCHVMLQYREQYAFTVPAATLLAVGYLDKIWCINGPYDPYVGLGNYSASYYNFWSSVYQYHHVNAVQIKMTIQGTNPPGTPAAGNIAWGYYRVGDSVPTDINQFLAYPHNKGFPYQVGTGAPQSYQIRDKMSTWKALGRNYDPAIDNTLINSNPAEACNMHLLMTNTTIGNAANFNVDVEIYFYCTFNKFRPNGGWSLPDPGIDA